MSVYSKGFSAYVPAAILMAFIGFGFGYGAGYLYARQSAATSSDASTIGSMTSREYLAVAALAMTTLCVGLFYWFQYRPASIRSGCEIEASEQAQTLMRTRAKMDPYNYNYARAVENGLFLVADQEKAYESCLRANGLEK